MKQDRHHLLSNTKLNRKKYGALIDDPRNIQLIDHDRHMEGKGDKLNEREFCQALNIMKCEYCKKYKTCIPPIYTIAIECRDFDFDKTKMKELEK